MPTGYQCLLLELDGCDVQRRLYVKQHEHSETQSEHSGALFVAGIPVKLENCLDEVFGAFGDVEQVQLHPRKTSAVIVFASRQTVTEVLAAAKKGAKVAFATNTQANHQHPTGLRKYVETHKAQYPGNDILENQLNTWMVAFEEAEERKRLALEAAGDDGWTVVTRKAGRKRKSGSTVTGGVSQAAAEAYAANKKSKLASDFYRFQSREQKRSELVELQSQFAAAKKQVHALRASRKFQG